MAVVSGPVPAAEVQLSFTTCGVTEWTVPGGVTAATFEVTGASGEFGSVVDENVAGRGGVSRGTVAVVSGEVIEIVVGCASDSGDFHGGAGGVSSTGAGGQGGDGSGVTRASEGQTLLVAGGGGGASECISSSGDFGSGGDGGGAGAGAPAENGQPNSAAPTTFGGAGAVFVPGLGGTGAGTFPGGDADGDVGGDGGGDSTDDNRAGGGGGGGLFGGGGGASDSTNDCGAGGGGGAGFAADIVTGVSGETGVNSGSGGVLVTFVEPDPVPKPIVELPTFTG
jgi:hypothetical protein